MTLSEKYEIKTNLLNIYVMLNEIKKKNIIEMLDEQMIDTIDVFHGKLGDYLEKRGEYVPNYEKENIRKH